MSKYRFMTFAIGPRFRSNLDEKYVSNDKILKLSLSTTIPRKILLHVSLRFSLTKY